MKYKNFYQRFFEDFQEEKVRDQSGRWKTKRTYTGFFYEADIPDAQKIMLRIWYLACYVLSFTLLFRGASLRVPCNSTWYCGLFTGFALMGYAADAVPLLLYLSKRKKLTVYEYRSSSKALIRFSKWTCMAATVLAGLCIISILMDHSQAGGQMFAMLLFLGASGALGLIYFGEQRLNYRELYNTGAGEQAP